MANDSLPCWSNRIIEPPDSVSFIGKDIAGAPGIANAMMDAFNIAQGRISRSRLAGDPPDFVINARLGKVGLFDFHRADELIAIGRVSTRRVIPDIADDIAMPPFESAISPR